MQEYGYEEGEQSMPKISTEFKTRLAGLSPGTHVCVVVLVDAAETGSPPEPVGVRSPRRSRDERRALFEERRRAARPVLDRIDEVLRHQGGSRLAHDVDALGAVPVETTPAGVRGLAALDGVAAVLEDQPVRGLA